MRTRKDLGQHFLTDPRLLARIADASGAGAGDIVLEVGPGPGGLTRALLDTGAAVLAIERDPRLGSTLVREFASRDFVLVEGDALALDWPALVGPWTGEGLRWMVAGNIPYYITSPLLEKALSPPLPAAVTYLVQREVADRLAALPGTKQYGALTVGIQAVAEVEVPMRVGKGAFTPPPKVDSALVRLVPRAEPLVAPGRVAALRRLTVDLFSYRRKRMQRALREARGLTAEESAALLARAGIDPDLRPEALSPADFVRLLGATGGDDHAEVASADGL